MEALTLSEKYRFEMGGNEFVLAEACSRFGGPKWLSGNVYIDSCLDTPGHYDTDIGTLVVMEGTHPFLCHASHWNRVVALVSAANEVAPLPAPVEGVTVPSFGRGM